MLHDPTVVLYIPITKNLSRTEYSTYIAEVENKIAHYNPERIVSLNKDFFPFFSKGVQAKYKDHHVFIQTFKPVCEKLDFLVRAADRNNIPLYILLGTQSLARDSDEVVSSCISSRHEIFVIQTLQQLKKTLRDLQYKQHGIIVSGLNYVVDKEFDTVVDRGQVHHYINTLNRVHITVGRYSYLNLDVALSPIYDGTNVSVEMFARPKALVTEDEEILLNNILPELNGTLSQ